MTEDLFFIPQATSLAGLCLTSSNWVEVGINIISYSLESLLLKPGFEVLKNNSDIKRYLGWSGKLVLNGTSLVADKNGNYKITSPFDGSQARFSDKQLLDLINHINPEYLLLPNRIVEEWLLNESIKVMNPSSLGKALTPYYISDQILEEDILELKNAGVQYLESDCPAQDASQGRVYAESKVLNLKESHFELDFKPIDPTCKCPTCSQEFTKAYLHHLLANTPLLCQRLLIQHNIWKINELVA